MRLLKLNSWRVTNWRSHNLSSSNRRENNCPTRQTQRLLKATLTLLLLRKKPLINKCWHPFLLHTRSNSPYLKQGNIRSLLNYLLDTSSCQEKNLWQNKRRSNLLWPNLLLNSNNQIRQLFNSHLATRWSPLKNTLKRK
jgi:hypothetical protein